MGSRDDGGKTLHDKTESMPTRDLSHPLDADTTVYPGDPAVELAPAATHASDGYRVTEVRFGSHSGTHLDAPSHTEPDGRDVDEFEVGEFAFDARLVDCSGVGAREAIERSALPDDQDPGTGDDPVTKEKATADMLVFRTGWDAHWGTEKYYDHPYLAREAAAWCAEQGYHVGLDVLSPDPSPSAREEGSTSGPEEESVRKEGDYVRKGEGSLEGEEGYSKTEEMSSKTEKASVEAGADFSESGGVPAHRELLGSERFVIENLTGLGGLPERFELRAYPLPLADADGSPVRAVAVW